MKKMSYFIIAVAVLVAIAGLVLYLTGGAAKSAETFFKTIKAGDYAAAYQMTSQQFRLSTNDTQFTEFLEQYTLGNYEKITWSSRGIQPGTAKLEGILLKDDQTKIPVSVELVKENNEWKILSLNLKGGVSAVKSVPSDADVAVLVQQSTSVFGKSVTTQDFSLLYDSVSERWKTQITPEKLSEVFEPFVSIGIDFAFVDTVEPTFLKKPSIDENGLLIVEGYYQYTEESRLNYKMKYIEEQGKWKLFGLNYQLQ